MKYMGDGDPPPALLINGWRVPEMSVMLLKQARTSTSGEPLRTPVAAEFPVAVGEAGQVLFDQTIPRHLVHRAAVSEVFLTDLRVTDETTFQVGAQWPRDHSFYRLQSP